MATPQANALKHSGLAKGASRAGVIGRVHFGRIAQTPGPLALVGLMVAGSVAIWTLLPLSGLWLASRLSDSSGQPTLAPLLVVAVGIPAVMAIATKALARLERAYARATGGTIPRVRAVPGWRRSIGDSSSLPPASLLEKLMVANVLLAAGSLVVWLFVFAGSGLPA